ncbi:Histone acetylation protein 2 [Ophiocordyceps camponoti-floridani]|uniref:Elongator complex protein 5 n=1 Tax=Ophiocordyceps camponoti-floridani TaxID=2030778 RepID=A0A8H4Q5J7_9HYPO|nr:Histone acetylation protein 2 [Ophiocordyceps camponoti-floridani]
MAQSDAHSRTHSLLLLQRLLNLRDGASPLTVILDSLEQTAGPVLAEFLTRAKIARTKSILASYTTVSKPSCVDVFVSAAGRDLETVRREVTAHYPVLQSQQIKPSQRAVLIIDSLNSLAAIECPSLANFLSKLATPAVSIIAVYHTDVPIVLPPSYGEYQPTPLAVFTHLATAILRPLSLQQELARKEARNRALQEPEWGLHEGHEGVIMGTKTTEADDVVIAMELRRRSGRAVKETFILVPSTDGIGRLSLLSDHPSFADNSSKSSDGDDQQAPQSTFDLGLTDKQRSDRAGVVPPYFDAQTDIGAGEGGRILYDMGREDDFDDEEDEI